MFPSEFNPERAARQRFLQREADLREVVDRVASGKEVARPGYELEVEGHRLLEDVLDWLRDNKVELGETDKMLGTGDFGAYGDDKWLVQIKSWLTTGAIADLKKNRRYFGRIRKTTGLTTLAREGLDPSKVKVVTRLKDRP